MIKLLVISGIFPWLTNLVIGFFVLWKNPRSNINRKFCLFSCSIAFWSIGSFIVQIIPDLGAAVFAAKICYLSACFLPVLFLDFAYTLVHAGANLSKINRSYLIAAIFAVLLFASPDFYAGLREMPNYHFRVSKPGFIYYIYFVYFCVGVSSALYVLWNGARKSQRPKRDQYLYVFFAYMAAVVAGLEYFLTVFGFLAQPPIDDYILILTFSLMAYAIIRHHLMDIEVIIKKTLVFTGVVTASVCAIALPLALIQAMIGTAVGISPFILMVIGIITSVLIYRPVDRFLTNVTDRYLFQKKINYRALLKEATEYLAHLESLKWQARRMVAFLVYKARIANASVFAFDSTDPSLLTLKASRPYIKDLRKRSIHLSHPAAHYMQTHKGPLEHHALRELKKSEKDPSRLKEFDEMIQLLEDQNAEAAIPCLSGDATLRATHGKLYLRGILFLGHQKSDEPYSNEDLDVFFTLGQESSIAFENARLYDEAVNKTRQLEVKTEQLQKINVELNKAQSSLVNALEAAERSEKQALAAKRKTEEMELELIRREKLLFVEKLVNGLAHEIFNAIAPIVYRLGQMEQSYIELFLIFDDFKQHLDKDTKKRLFTHFNEMKEGLHVFSIATTHVKDIVNTLTPMQQRDDKSIKPFDLKTYWKVAEPMMAMETHGETFSDVPIEYDIERGLPPVLGNATQLNQVVINLFRNALYAMNNRKDKKIRIAVGFDPTDHNYVQIRFSDNGSGIPKEILPKIFDFQFTTKGEKGQGIGLNQCKLIIERVFNGAIECESEVGKGTAFIIRIPVWKGEDAHANQIADR